MQSSALGQWCAVVFLWTEKKGTTGICLLEKCFTGTSHGRKKRREQIFSEALPLFIHMDQRGVILDFGLLLFVDYCVLFYSFVQEMIVILKGSALK